MTTRALYCGDTALNGAASYLASLLTLWGIPFDYVPSDQPLSLSRIPSSGDLFIFSDYPAGHVDPDVSKEILDRVSAGAGLLMIGGWESFRGLGGHWDQSPLGNALPVSISSEDDRMNCDGPVFVVPAATPHPVTDQLPWTDRPPLIGGFNRFEADADATVLLEAVQMTARHQDGSFILERQATHPLLVTGTLGHGKTAALATDVAPHWIGPMVDWGDTRVTASAPGTDGVEVGNWYAQFFRQLILWM